MSTLVFSASSRSVWTESLIAIHVLTGAEVERMKVRVNATDHQGIIMMNNAS